MQAYEAMLSRLQELKGVISGTIRVATIYSLGLYDLPAYLKKYLKAHPKVNVHVEYRHTDQVYGDVVGNVVDIGLVACPIRDPKLEVMPLGKHKLVLICHPDHPLAKAKRVPLQAIAGQKFAGFGPDIPTRTAIDKILREHHVKVQYAMEFDNIETVKRAVEIDAGLSIVPESTVVQEVNTHTLAAVAIQDGEFYRPWAAIYKRDKILSPATKLFLDLLKGSTGPRRKAT
jgi:DNA-binding transcriptional LysR family regulator